MQYNEKRKQQRWIIGLSYPFFTLIFIIPGLDYRFGWSHIPLWLVLVGMIMVLVGYFLFFYVIYTNKFASRVVEVTENQKVIQIGTVRSCPAPNVSCSGLDVQYHTNCSRFLVGY